MKALAAMAALLCLAPQLLSADDAGEYPEELEHILPALTAEQRGELLSTGELSNPLSKRDPLSLVPTRAMETTMNAGLAAIEYTVGMEVLFLVPVPDKRFSMDELATMVLEASTLGGLQYYSASRDRTQTLVEDSYTINNTRDLNKIPDTIVSGVPSRGVAHIYQRDSTFGWNPNTTEYTVDDSSCHMLTTNDSAFRWALIPIIPEGGLHSHLLLLRSDHYLVYYSNFGAKALSVRFFERRIQESFYNRLVALHEWFLAKLDD